MPKRPSPSSYLVFTVVVVLVWLVAAAVTKYTLEEVAVLMPAIVILLGITAGILLFWTKLARESRRRER